MADAIWAAAIYTHCLHCWSSEGKKSTRNEEEGKNAGMKEEHEGRDLSRRSGVLPDALEI